MEKDRKIIFVEPDHVHGTTMVINYDAENTALNDFLHLFDIWGSHGYLGICTDNKHHKVRFECSHNFYGLIVHSEDFQQAFKRLGVDISFNYDDRIINID